MSSRHRGTLLAVLDQPLKLVIIALCLGLVALFSQVPVANAQSRRTLQNIQNQIRKEAQERQKENQDRMENPTTHTPTPHPAFAQPTPTATPAAPAAADKHETFIPPNKVFFSWLGGLIKLHRLNGQIYLTLFKR